MTPLGPLKLTTGLFMTSTNASVDPQGFLLRVAAGWFQGKPSQQEVDTAHKEMAKGRARPLPSDVGRDLKRLSISLALAERDKRADAPLKALVEDLHEFAADDSVMFEKDRKIEGIANESMKGEGVLKEMARIIHSVESEMGSLAVALKKAFSPMDIKAEKDAVATTGVVTPEFSEKLQALSALSRVISLPGSALTHLTDTLPLGTPRDAVPQIGIGTTQQNQDTPAYTKSASMVDLGNLVKEAIRYLVEFNRAAPAWGSSGDAQGLTRLREVAKSAASVLSKITEDLDLLVVKLAREVSAAQAQAQELEQRLPL